MDGNDFRPLLRGLLILLLFYISLTSGLPPGGLSHFPNSKYIIETNQSESTITEMDYIPLTTSSPISSSLSTPLVFSDTNTNISSNSVSSSTSSDSLISTSSSTLRPNSSNSSSNANVDEITSTNSPRRNNSGDDYKRINSTGSGDSGSGLTEESSLPEPPVAQPLQKETFPGNGTVQLRGKCNFTEQCVGEHVDCRVGICKCSLGHLPRPDNGDLCGVASNQNVEVPQADPTMIGVVIGLALMSVTLCIVLRLFAKARFRENRTIFNTPNPRLMNVSLLKGSKTLLRGNSAGQRSRRGSQVSIASGQVEGEGPPASSTNPPPSSRPRPHRQLSTDTTNTEGNSTPSSRPISSVNKNKFRQDSVASASNV